MGVHEAISEVLDCPSMWPREELVTARLRGERLSFAGVFVPEDLMRDKTVIDFTFFGTDDVVPVRLGRTKIPHSGRRKVV